MNPMIDAYALDLRLRNRTPATIDCRTRMLYQADYELPHGLAEADTAELRWWMSRYPSWSDATRATYDGHLRGLYGFAVSGPDPWLYTDPTLDLPRPKRPQCVPNPVSKADLEVAYALSDEWWQLIIVLAAYAGLRVMEILALCRADVTADTIRVRHGKGNKPASLPTHPAVWRHVEPRRPGLLVRDPQPTRSSVLSAMARRHFNRIGLPHVHLHLFRHSYATFLMDEGVDIRTVQTLTRHGSLSTLAGYLKVADERRRRAVLTLPEIGAAA